LSKKLKPVDVNERQRFLDGGEAEPLDVELPGKQNGEYEHWELAPETGGADESLGGEGVISEVDEEDL
jgi:hypothetical protein